MSTSRRVQRVEKEVRQVIANYLLAGFREPLTGLVSVSRVIMTADLKLAKVYVTMMGDQADRDYNLETLQNSASQIQRQIHSQLRMKNCPKLKFFFDETFDHQMKIEKILDGIAKEKEPVED